jgi:hypothetical protein
LGVTDRDDWGVDVFTKGNLELGQVQTAVQSTDDFRVTRSFEWKTPPLEMTVDDVKTVELSQDLAEHD